jgi:hypothetical protein
MSEVVATKGSANLMGVVPFIAELKTRNETLFYFGLICLVFAMSCLVLTRVTSTQVYNVNAWYKPFKFAFSTFLFAWAMGWYVAYLPSFNPALFNWTVIIMLSFEIVYISIQAGKGQISHYNISTPFYAVLFQLMAIAATIVTLYTAYIGFLFFKHEFTSLPDYYVWAIRLGILIFVIFSFEGFAMGARLSHTVGMENDNSNLFIVGWSRLVGDLRIAHFIGMHALQLLPVVAFYLLKNTKATILVAVLYGMLALFTLIQALNGKPLIKGNEYSREIRG